MGFYASNKEKVQHIEKEYYKLYPLIEDLEGLVDEGQYLLLEDKLEEVQKQMRRVEISVNMKVMES